MFLKTKGGCHFQDVRFPARRIPYALVLEQDAYNYVTWALVCKSAARRTVGDDLVGGMMWTPYCSRALMAGSR
jgi:hypothetical protein